MFFLNFKDYQMENVLVKLCDQLRASAFISLGLIVAYGHTLFF